MKTREERLEKVIEVMKMIRQLKLEGRYPAIDELTLILKSYLNSTTRLLGKIDFPELIK